MDATQNELSDVRLVRPDRKQRVFRPECLDEQLAADHFARTIWDVTGRLDWSAFYAPIEVRGDQPGRPAIDPRLLVALWLYAYVENVGNGRELARLCESHDAYRWLCGNVSINYHTLNDFRVSHADALKKLLTDVLAVLLCNNVVQVERISQDGTRVRASAGSGSFRTRAGLEKCRAAAAAHIEALERVAEQAPAEAARRQAARQRAAQERQARVEAALMQLSEMEQIKANPRVNEKSRSHPARASTTDPEARRMRMPEGGFAPAYNVQLAVDPHSRAIVGVEVTKHGTDHGEDQPLRAQIAQRTGRRVREQLLDGGYVKLESIERAAAEGVAIYAPLPRRRDGSVCTHRSSDSPALANWRARMNSAEGKSVYAMRGKTSETVNADLKTHRGLSRFTVRGLSKCGCIALWAALAYNLLHFANVIVAI